MKAELLKKEIGGRVLSERVSAKEGLIFLFRLLTVAPPIAIRKRGSTICRSTPLRRKMTFLLSLEMVE